MKSEVFVSSVVRWRHRLLLVFMLCFCAAANTSFFPLPSSLFPFHSSLASAQNVQNGKASFYSKRATGSRTANGERLHHDSLTCAHRSYPFGTLLKVTNLVNGQQVIVRVNDRGPFRKGRIIDLSWGAAKEIGMIAQGIAPVTVEKITQAVIPFLPEEDDVNIAKFEFDLADIDVSGIEPIWQKARPRIDQKEVMESMRETARQSAEESLQQSRLATDNERKAPRSNAAASSAANQKDALDEINSKPNSSKAYLKREGGH